MESTFSGQLSFRNEMERTTLLMASVRNNRSIPSELFAEFQTSFYTDTREAAFKALGVE